MQPVLILGAGINGMALARELAWQGVPVVIVDRADLSAGATAYSSRLIHGGLRYLEYGEFALVAESLAERARLAQLAPHHVRPLRLLIPVRRRTGGLIAGALRFLGGERWAAALTGPRGAWVVRLGLSFYDYLARHDAWPRHAVYPVGSAELPPLAPGVARWWCTYFDAQIAWPERFVIALWDDARQASRQFQVDCTLYTYATVSLAGDEALIRDAAGEELDSFSPSAIVNATGAWVDQTLAQLDIASPLLMGGTRGSHLVLDRRSLRDWLGDDGLYVEATDGRPVFILPWGDLTLVGTTDLPFVGDPADAVTTDAEIEYLLAAVNRWLPDDRLQRADVLGHYSGVRPLPATRVGSTAAITRRHWLQEHAEAPVPMYSVIGGKLTTCRSLAESTCDALLARLGRKRQHSTRDKPLSGSRGYPSDQQTLATQQRCLADEFGLTPETIAAVWRLFGTRSAHVLAEATEYADDRLVAGTNLPRSVVRWVCEHERPTKLEDLVERRLLLHFDRRLTRRTLVELAELLADADRILPEDAHMEVSRCLGRLRNGLGRVVGE